MVRIETLGEYLVKYHQVTWYIPFDESIRQSEVLIVVQNIQVGNRFLVSDFVPAKTDHLIKMESASRIAPSAF